MRIPNEEVEQTAHMARLALSEGEIAAMAEDLGRILGYAARLQEIDVTGVPPLTHPLPRPCPLRPDVPGAQLPTDTALAGAPAAAEGHFVVPAILGGRAGKGEG